METKKLSGCAVFGLVLAGLLIALIITPFALRTRSAKHAREEEARRHSERLLAEESTLRPQGSAEDKAAVLAAGSLGRYSPTNFGSTLTREHFVALMSDRSLTRLARQAFAAKASGQTVRWLLQTADVNEATSESPGLTADFELPYRIETAAGEWSGSSLTLQADFPATERDRLLRLRCGDWVTVEGRLQLVDGTGIRLLNARIALPQDAEAPGR
jgi:hypothetical protein